MTEETIPRSVTDRERWIARHQVEAIRVEYRQTGADTAETYVHLTSKSGGKVCWLDSSFRSVATLELSWATCVRAHPGIREAVEAREEWEKRNRRELAEYERLKAKFGNVEQSVEQSKVER